MSSILDALKKLEEEKAEAARATPLEFEDDTAERDLVRGGRPPQVTIQFSPKFVLMVLGAVAVLVVFVMNATRAPSTDAQPRAHASASAARSGVPATPDDQAATPIAGRPEPPAHAALPVAAPERASGHAVPAPVAVAPTLAPPIKASELASVAATSSEPSPPAKITRAPSRKETVPEVSGPTESARPKTIANAPLPSKEVAAPRTRVSAEASVPAPDSGEDELPDPPSAFASAQSANAAAKVNPSSPAFDMYALPILTESDKLRLGLKGLEVNMLRSPNKNRPNPSAIINMQQVYVNEVIQGTKAKLIGVDVRGIAIEVGGERFFVRR